MPKKKPPSNPLANKARIVEPELIDFDFALVGRSSVQFIGTNAKTGRAIALTLQRADVEATLSQSLALEELQSSDIIMSTGELATAMPIL